MVVKGWVKCVSARMCWITDSKALMTQIYLKEYCNQRSGESNILEVPALSDGQILKLK